MMQTKPTGEQSAVKKPLYYFNILGLLYNWLFIVSCIMLSRNTPTGMLVVILA